MTQQQREAETAPADKDWFGGRRWTGIGAIAVLLVIAVAVGILLANRHTDHKANPPTAVTPSTQTSPASQSAPSVTKPLDTTIPTAAPAGVTWSVWQTVALPQSATAGPSQGARKTST